MRPFRILIFFAAVGILLLVIALALPEEGIRITEDFRISFLSVSDFFQKDTTMAKAEVEELLSTSTVTSDPEAGLVHDPLVPPGMFSTPDTVPAGAEPDHDQPVPRDRFSTPDTMQAEAEPVRSADTDKLSETVLPLEFAEGNEALLAPFFRRLDGLREGTVKRTRILHFGDSQIENDRMTALIRYRLQQHFGGSGTGLVPAIPLYSGHLAFYQEYSDRWQRHTWFGKRDTAIHHNVYGPMGAFASVPEPREVMPFLYFRFNTDRRTGRCNRIRVFMHSTAENASIIFRLNDTVQVSFTGLPAGYNTADLSTGTLVEELNIYAGFLQGGRIYGISFETEKGLQVDNIAMRGSSGLFFTKLDREQLRAMMEDLAPGLLILQFGGNVVPHIRDADYYRRAFTRELRFIKGLCPGVPVIVIGPSDMSFKQRGRFRTHPAVEPVRDALRSATLQSGFAFWDLYQAMGGQNSMPSFVEADPPLASSDYVHFTPLGANLMAEMFYNALILAYREYSSENGPS